MKNKTAVLAFALVAVLTAGAALAHPLFGIDMTSEARAAAQAAIENGDYATWRSVMEAQLTEENFQKTVDAHKAMDEKRARMEATRAEIDAAIMAGDYNAWKAAVEDADKFSGITEIITEEKFATFAEMHTAIKNDDFEVAKHLAEQLGLPKPGFRMGFHGRMGHFMAR